MAHDEPVGQVAARPGMSSPPSSSSWNRWPPPAASSSHDQFFSVVKKVRPTTPVAASTLNRAGTVTFGTSVGASKLKLGAHRPGASKAPVSLLKAAPLRTGLVLPSSSMVKTGSPKPGHFRITDQSSKVAKTGPPKPGSFRAFGPPSNVAKMGSPKPSPFRVSGLTSNVAKMGTPKPGPFRAVSPTSNVAKMGTPKHGPSRISDASEIGLQRSGPPQARITSRVCHPAIGARPRAPSGGNPLPAPDHFRPKPSATAPKPSATAPNPSTTAPKPSATAPKPSATSPKPSAAAPKPRVSWDLDLLTDGPQEDDGGFASDIEQSPTFLTNDFDPRLSGAPPLSILDRVKMGLKTGRPREMLPKKPRGRPPKAPGELKVKRKYVKKKHLANGASGQAESDGVPYVRPKWKGTFEKARNDFSKAVEKQRRHKEMIAVRVDGSVPHMVTLLPKDPADPTGPVPVVSPSKDGRSPPKLASPSRRLSGGSGRELSGGKSETKPLFEHIDEDWAVIKKSLEKTEPKKERKLSETGSSGKTSSLTLTPSPTKKSDRSDELSTDEDIGNDLNAPLHNLERLQDQMIKNLMDDGALAALKRRKKKKAVQIFGRKKMSDYWKSKLVPGRTSLQMKLKRSYHMRPLTSDNVKHMEEAIAAVLAAPSPEASPEKRPASAMGARSPSKSQSFSAQTPGLASPPSQRRPSGQMSQLPSSPQQLHSSSRVFHPAHPSMTQSTSQSSPQSAPMPAPRSMPQPVTLLPSSSSAGPMTTAAMTVPESRTSSESDPAAAARLLQVKQELAARFLSDLHQERAQLRAAEQQRLAWQQQTTAAQQQQQLLGWRPMIRVRHRRRRRAGQPRIVCLTEAAFRAGHMVTDAALEDDDAADGLAPPPELQSPPPVSMPTSRLKEFLDTGRVSRYRSTCGYGTMAFVNMPEEPPERLVFVSERPLAPEVEQTLVQTDPSMSSLCDLPSPVVAAPWSAEQSAAAAASLYGPPLPSGGVMSPSTSVGWSGGVMSPASGAAGPGQPANGNSTGSSLIATTPTVPTVAPASAAVPTTPTAIPTATPTATPDNASDVSMEERPLRIVLPETPSAEPAPTPAGSTPQTPLSVSPRVAPTPALAGLAGQFQPGGTPAPGTPAGVSPRIASGASTAAPSPLPPDPESLPFACNRCPTRLATLTEQVYHEIRMHMTEQNLFRCLGCPMLVPLNGDLSLVLDGLLDHYMRHVDEDGRLVSYDTSGDFFRCQFCPRVFEDPSAYGSHEVQCRFFKHICATCQGRFGTDDQLKWHEVDHLRAPDGKYCCDHCDSKFTKREQLLGHRRFHFKDKNVECPKCGKKFMTVGMLAMHNKWKHSQGPCRFCGRPFTSATARQAHEEHLHLKHMMHMCNVCHFRVMTATQLRVHKRTHSDEKPHRCSTCDEKFVSRNLLKKHRIARHETRPAAAADGTVVEPTPAPPESSSSQSGSESARTADGSLTPAELRQLFDRYTASFTGPKVDMTLSDLDTDEDENEKRDLLDSRAKEELFRTKDKNSVSVWSCPVCNAFFTKLWGVRAHITLKHPGTSARPVLHDDKDTSAVSKQAFLKEIKRNAKTAKREEKMEAKRQARIAAYGDEMPRRGRPRKYFVSQRPLIIHEPIDPSQPRKRGRPRKNPDDLPTPPRVATTAAPPPKPPTPPPPPPPKPTEPPPDHVERRRWKCLTCEDQSPSYDDLVTHTYLAHPDADLPRFEVVITYVPKPVPKAPAKPATPPPSDATPGPETEQDHDAAILDAARVRGAEKRRAPSATKVPAGAKRRSIPSAVKEGVSARDRGRGRGGTPSGSRGATPSGGRGATPSGGRSTTNSGGRVATPSGSRSASSRGRGRASSGDSYRKSYSNSSRRFKAEGDAEPAAEKATDDADKLYCYCQSPYDEVSEMIGCDNDDCKHEWFHFECVGIVIAPKGKWFCPDCSGDKKSK